MLNKKLKYESYLSNFNNCPSIDFKEISGGFFRWTKLKGSENNFLPLSIMKKPPQRLLDDQDKICISYGLSFFDSKQNAFNKYTDIYNKQKREHLKELFKDEKGTYIALVNIKEEDGIADKPNEKNGHFTFHEYHDTDLSIRMYNEVSIFETNGAIREKI